MRLNFRQGLVTFQKDITGKPVYLAHNPAAPPFVNLVVSPTPLVITFANGASDYLATFDRTIENAWVRTGTAVGEVLQIGDMKFSVIEETTTTSRHGIARALDTSQTTTTLQMYLLVRESQDSVENSRTSCVVRLPLVDKGGVGEDAAVCKIDLLTGRISTSIEGSAFQSSNFVWQVTRYISLVWFAFTFITKRINRRWLRCSFPQLKGRLDQFPIILLILE